jgi:hypothetical protein
LATRWRQTSTVRAEGWIPAQKEVGPQRACYDPRMKYVIPLAFLVLSACAAGIPDHVELTPAAENVEFAFEPPGSNGYQEVGKVTGVAQGTDTEATTEAAKNDLRNKAAALGATVVTIDENVGQAVPLTRTLKVKVSGRAYKPVD